MDTNLLQKLEKNFNKIVASNQIHEAVLFVENTNEKFSYSKGYGGKDIDSPLLIVPRGDGGVDVKEVKRESEFAEGDKQYGF